MNSNIRQFASDVEDRLNRVHKAGAYDKRFGYVGMNTKNMDEDVENKSVISSTSGGKMSAFDKLLHKDNKKLNRMQDQARNFLKTGGSTYDPEESKVSANSRHSVSSGALPQLNPKGRLGGL